MIPAFADQLSQEGYEVTMLIVGEASFLTRLNFLIIHVIIHLIIKCRF